MLRRGLVKAPRVQPAFGTAVRSYTDYHHHQFPKLPIFVYGWPFFLGIAYLFWLSCGSIWWQSNRELKSDLARSWRRTCGTGYRWSTEWGPQINTIYKDLPSSAE
jgi:hypothetical protein